jgi:P-type Ca2+ transporter type 2C
MAAQATEGSGEVLVIAVGEDSEWGRTMAMVQGDSEDTPLQEALAVLAAAIGKVGLVVGVVCFIVLLVRCESPSASGYACCSW